jgi:Protein of unknown function (DUF1203)
MSPYRVVAIPEDVASEVRASGRSPRYGHPAHREIARGYGPCRHCLRDFAVGVDERILFTYDAFSGREPMPLPGPVFIHAAACSRYPEDGGFPADIATHELLLEGFAAGRQLRGQETVRDGAVGPAVVRLLADPAVDYLQVRDANAGCFDFRIERATA